MTVPPDETGWGIWDGDNGFNRIVAGSGELEVSPVSIAIFLVVLFLLGRKAVKSLPFLFFREAGFFLGTGISEKIRVWDVDLVRGLETATVGVVFFLEMGGEGGVKESSLGTEIVGTVDSARWGHFGVESTGDCEMSSCCPP